MKRLLLLVTAIALSGTKFVNAAETSDTALEVNIEYETLRITDAKKIQYTFVVLLTNRSDKPVTTPTRSFDGNPCCFRSVGNRERAVTYFVGTYPVGDRTVRPSPLRFAPVTLNPGESTEFARFVQSVTDPLEVFSARVEVDGPYARPLGWWWGAVEGTINLKEKKPTML